MCAQRGKKQRANFLVLSPCTAPSPPRLPRNTLKDSLARSEKEKRTPISIHERPSDPQPRSVLTFWSKPSKHEPLSLPLSLPSYIGDCQHACLFLSLNRVVGDGGREAGWRRGRAFAGERSCASGRANSSPCRGATRPPRRPRPQESENLRRRVDRRGGKE